MTEVQKANGTCGGVVDLADPTRSEPARGWRPAWYTVGVYECPVCETRLHLAVPNGAAGTVVCGARLA